MVRRYKAADGAFQTVPLCADKTASKQMLAKLIADAKLAEHGLGDRFAEHRKRPLGDHLADWGESLRADGAGDRHVKQTVACAGRVLDGCGFVFPADLDATCVQRYLAGLRGRHRALPPLDPAKADFTKRELAELLVISPSAVPSLVKRHRLAATGKGKARRFPRETAEALRGLRAKGRSVKTSNLYLAAVKQFAGWLVLNRRLADNPLAHLAGGNVSRDRRHDRRALPAEELAAILREALASTRTFRELTGRDRHFLYLAAMTTGYRAGELAELTPEAFRLDDDPPAVVLGAHCTKNQRTALQPLPPDVAEALGDYLVCKPAGLPVWPGGWVDNAADMLRIDLDAAGIPYAVDGPDGPLYADFHSLRHSFIALLDRSGATLKEAMQLARHSDPKLTMAVYGRAQLHDLAGAVGGMPSLLAAGRGAETLAATGTDAIAPDTRLHQNYAPGCQRMPTDDNSLMGSDTGASNEKPPYLKGVESDCERLMAVEESSPSRTRTYNKPVNRS